MRWLVAVLILTSLAGCINTQPLVVVEDAPHVFISGVLLDKDTDTPLVGAHIALESNQLEFAKSNETGGFKFRVTPGPCTLSAEADGYVEAVVGLECDRHRHLTIRLGQVLEAADIIPVAVPTAAPDDPVYTVQGNVHDGDGLPLAGTTVSILENAQPLASHVTDATGEFAFQLVAGNYTLQAVKTCAAPVSKDVALAGDTAVSLVLGDANTDVPPAPTGLDTVQGPGPGMVTLVWDALTADPPIHHFSILRDGSHFMDVGNAQAWADTTPDSHDYAVVSHNVCGTPSVPSTIVSGTPMAGYGSWLDVSISSGTGIKTTTQQFTVLDAEHNHIGTRDFRAVQGVGNCCETYVAADKTGRVFEYGGSYILFSDDEGQSWSQVGTPTPKLGAEGAIVQAPGGDILAFNWDPYTGDQLWIHKWIAATGDWVYQQIVLHQPFYDRPWVAVIEGPFEVQGLVAPYLTFVMSNYAHADLMQVSLDGLNYVAMSQRSLTQLGSPATLNWDLPVDPERDWIQAMRETFIVPIDDQQGLRGRAAAYYCDWAALDLDLLWGCANFGTLTNEPARADSVRVDSLGNIHVMEVAAGDKSFTYRVSHDEGRSWKEVKANIPNNLVIEDWDSKVNGAQDQLVMSVRASVSTDESTIDQDMLFRFAGVGSEPYLKEIILAGKGDHVFGGGLNSEYDRFDYTTVTLLPSGAAALSFGDSAHNPPAIAIELV